MKKYTYRKFLILLFMINLIAIAAVYIKYCNARLPDTIHINKGETVSLCYDVPVSATIDHQTIRLNQPIVFKGFIQSFRWFAWCRCKLCKRTLFPHAVQKGRRQEASAEMRN